MNENKFTGKAELYRKYRPSYPDALISFLKENTGAKVVADIGAGTGIFTEKLVIGGFNVTAVEPNEDMLKMLSSSLGDKIKTVKASAENTGLAAHEFDLVTAAQAFHWFDKPRFKKECIRILKENGSLAVIWNTRVQTDISKYRNEICVKYCGEYQSGHVNTGYEDFDSDTFFRDYFKSVKLFSLENPYYLTKEAFIGDNLSRSYTPRKTDAHYKPFVGELESLFDKFSENGTVAQPYITECYLGQF